MAENRLIPTHTHNQILAVIHALHGGINFMIITIGLFVVASLRQEPLFDLKPEELMILIVSLIALLFSAVYLITGIGLWKRKGWARTTALILGCLFVWYPVGLGLGVYAWLFLKSEAGKQLYIQPWVK
jgi:uncharacterized membrane protein (DUF2068 family)